LYKSNPNAGSPSKPQNLKTVYNYSYQTVLTWNGNSEPNLTGYKIYKAKTTGDVPSSYTYLTNVSSSSTSWTDNEINVDNPTYKIFYKISSTNSNNKESVLSEYSSINYVTNTVTTNTTLNGDIKVGSNTTVQSGVTLTIAAGSTINFANGSSLIINGYGTLIANGTLSSPITFDFISPNYTTENGIKLTNGSMGTINYCQIRNAYRGIYENSVTLNVTNSAFSGCTNGLYLSNSSPTVQYCNFHDNTNAGIYLINYASPNLYNNSMSNNYYGVYSITYSTPHFGLGSTRGKNEIRNNYCGIYCWNNSLPMLGQSSPLNGGYNNLVNAAHNIDNESSGTVYANHIWWGDIAPANFKIYGSTLSTNYLTGDTTRAFPPLSKTSGNSDIPMLSELDKAYQLIASNNPAQARTVCLNLINNYPTYSVSYNALNLLKETYSENELSSKKDIYNSIFNNKVKKDLYATAGLILSNIDKENKLKHIDNVINNYTGQAVIELALFDKFVFYYFEEQDRDNSLAISKELDALFPKSQGAIEAHRILGDETFYKIQASNEQSLQKTASQTPTEFALLGNYPNPFNPTTRINYQLPKDGLVTLKVYDILGREVASLVNENQKAGNYSIPFDASKLSSGIYIYTIHANDFIQSKKMNLVK